MTFGLGGNLWQHRDFKRFWLAQSVSVFGNQFSGFALPVLAILSFNATALDVGIMNALAIAPYTFLGLFVGVWVDRLRKRRLMILCNLGRMLTLASVPISYVLHVLSLTQLFATSLVIGLFSVFFDISYQAYLPTLVERENLVEGNQKLQLSVSGAQVAGPGLAGLVYQAIGGAFTVLADAMGYLSSAVLLLSVKKEEPKKGPSGRRFFGEMKEGLDLVFGSRYLRAIAGSTSTNNLSTNMVGAVIGIFALRMLHFSTSELGAVGSIGAIGFVGGVLFVRRVSATLGLGRSLAIFVTVPIVVVLYPLALLGYPFLVLSGVSFVAGMSAPTYNVIQVSLRQSITPDRLQGRMNATMRVFITGAALTGALIGGVLGDQFGVVNAMYVGGLISGLAGLWIVFSPVYGLKKNPEQTVK